jgi:hypothetical protein
VDSYDDILRKPYALLKYEENIEENAQQRSAEHKFVLKDNQENKDVV